jgi:hypothetical protein
VYANNINGGSGGSLVGTPRSLPEKYLKNCDKKKAKLNSKFPGTDVKQFLLNMSF